MRLRTGLAVAILIVPLAEGAAAAPRGAVARHVLPNGLTVLVRLDSTAAVVAASLQVRAGVLVERAETAGVTNFLQRVMVRGTARRSALQLAEAAGELGGGLEASGEADYGEIRGSALARNWEPLLALVAEVALVPALAAEEVERERTLIQSQIQTRADTPFQRAFDEALDGLYGGHPYARPSLGTLASLGRITREDLRAHYAAVYRPERMVLAVSGDVPVERVLKTVERLFGGLPRGALPAPPALPAPAPRGERRLVERPAHQAQVLVGYLGPSLSDPDYPAARVLATVLGGGMSGRLFVELREKRGLAYSAGVLAPLRTGPGFLVAYTGTAPANAEAVLAAMLAELERVRTDAVSPQELERAKAYLLGSLAMDRRTNARHAWYLAFFELVGAGWEFPPRHARAIAAVGAADVARVAQKYLTRPAIVLLRPAEKS